jgi:hypothetical protein
MKISLLLLSFTLAGGLLVQDRAKKLTSDDVPRILQNASKAFEAKRYAACASEVRTALGLLSGLVRQQLVAVMPAAPAGFEIVQQDSEAELDAGNPFAAMMGLTGSPAERVYRKQEGDGEIRISITPESPMASALAMGFGVAALDKSAEVITYKGDKGLLRKEGDRLTLQILLSGKHVIDVQASGIDDESLLKLIDQAFVDRVLGALQA